MYFLYISTAKILSHLKCSIQMMPSLRSCYWFPQPPLVSSAERTCSLFFFSHCKLYFSHSTNYKLYLCKYIYFPEYLKFCRDRGCILLICMCSIVLKNTMHAPQITVELNWMELDVTFPEKPHLTHSFISILPLYYKQKVNFSSYPKWK